MSDVYRAPPQREPHWLAAELARRDAETVDVLRAELARREALAAEREAAAGPPPPGVARQGRGWLAAQLAKADVDRAEDQAQRSSGITTGGRQHRSA